MNDNANSHYLDKFNFGKNWSNFINNYLTEEQKAIASQQTLAFLGMKDLSGKTVLDVGSGSGLFSRVFFEAGARAIVSFDCDKESIKCTEKLRATAKNNSANWTILEGSILNNTFIRALGTFDIVYSWGVLHHTGNMWKALNNVASCVNKQGLIYIAIYNKVPGRGINSSAFWKTEKRFFNKTPLLIQHFIIYLYVINFIFNMLIRFNNPIAVIKNRKFSRGMSWYTNIVDWLGGYPYEYASVDEIFYFFYKKNFELINLKSVTTLDCNEFLFRRK